MDKTGQVKSETGYQLAGQIYKGGVAHDFDIVDGSIVGRDTTNGDVVLEGDALEGALFDIDELAADNSLIKHWRVEINSVGSDFYWDYSPTRCPLAAIEDCMFDDYELEIGDAPPDPSADITTSPANPTSICESADDVHGTDNERVSIVMGKIDTTTDAPDVVVTAGSATDWFNFACEHDPLYKTRALQHTLDPLDLLDPHTPDGWKSTFQMITAKYCISEEEFTQPGVDFRYQDNESHMEWDIEPEPGYPIEAIWDENSAKCVNRPRLRLRKDVERLCGKTIPRCKDPDPDNPSSTLADKYIDSGDYDWITYNMKWDVCANPAAHPNKCASSVPTITAAINAAAPGGYIRVGPGTYNENVNVNKNLYITGAGRKRTIINGTASNTSVVTIPGNVEASLLNMTLQGGDATTGGGIHNDGKLYIGWVSVANNTADEGGGVYTSANTHLTISSSLISDNQARFGSGGGILAGNNSTVRIHDTIVTYNKAPLSAGGGGVFNNNATVTISDSELLGNEAGYGSAMEVTSGGKIEVTNVDISGNNSLLTWETSIKVSSGGELIVRLGTQTIIYSDTWDCFSASPGDDPLGVCELNQFTSIEAGERHTCALLATGEVRCWGDSRYGQLGYGTSNSVGQFEAPASVGNVDVGGSVQLLTAGLWHNCALLDTSKVRCWGWGGSGQLGYGDTENIGDDEMPATKTAFDFGSPVKQLVGGGHHTCALLESGDVYCWGQGTYGQLGYGNTDNIGDTTGEDPMDGGPVSVGGPVQQLAAGLYHTCALLESGDVRCWGRGGYGRLGYGNGTDNIGDTELPSSQNTVAMGPSGEVIEITAGYHHTCALLDTGGVRCWGRGANGRLGYGDELDMGDNESPPSFDVNVGGIAVQVDAGATHTCAVLDTDEVRCWGGSSRGQLGYGNTDDIGDDETPASVVAPVDVGGEVTQLSTSAWHTCVTLEAGTVRCWGYGQFGQLGYLGNTNTGDDETPASKGDVNFGSSVLKLTSGSRHTCALLDTGKVRCWGEGANGRLGYGDELDIGDYEKPVDKGYVDVGGVVTEIAAGSAHTCAILDTGAVRCWGEGANGRLGYGDTDDIGDTETPASQGDVTVGDSTTQIVVGGAHTCALLSSGAVRCWGRGTNGRLGYGDTDDIGDNETPASQGDVNVGGTVTQLGAGREHTCALLSTGSVRCWGKGGDGQLGYGDTLDIGDDETPASKGDVNVGGTVAQLIVGGDHTCVVLDTGAVRCWGKGDYGQLGYGNTDNMGDDETPTGDVSVGGTVAKLTAGGDHTCAVLDTGAVRCWGKAVFGQLGYGTGDNVGDDELPSSVGTVDIAPDPTPDNSIAALTAGENHNCALLDTGAVRCWGEGFYGQLGHAGGTADVGDGELPASIDSTAASEGSIGTFKAEPAWATPLRNVAMQGTATQNPVHSPYPASNAIDGDTTGMSGNYSHTELASEPWWQVDLGGQYTIQRIDLFNRIDCCAERLSDFYVLVSDTAFSSSDLTTSIAEADYSFFHAGQAGDQLNLPASVTGRHVRVQLSGTDYLHLGEVQVWAEPAWATPLTNVATQGTATQSSDFEPASRAIDGDTTSVVDNYSHTLEDSEAWWQVDLGAQYDIRQIDLFNRIDCCDERLSDFYVLVSDTAFTSTDLATSIAEADYSFFHAGQAGDEFNLPTSVIGRYVRVQLSGTDYLHLAEVQVWAATSLGNVATQGTATQSSDFELASRAIDGNTTGIVDNYSHTLEDSEAWWQVDLGAQYDIRQIDLFNRIDCCRDRLSDFHVLVSDTAFTSSDLATAIAEADYSFFHVGQPGDELNLPTYVTGRYVRVQLSGTDYLHLAEVQVWALTELPTGLIHHWPGDGDTTDSVGTTDGVNGSTTAFTSGINGQAFSFDGAQSSVAILPVDISPSVLPDVTFGMWINVRSHSNDYGWVLGHDNAGYDRGLNVTDSRYGHGVAGGTGYAPHNSTLPQLKDHLDEWKCIAAVYDSSAQTATYYVDGATQTVTANPGDGLNQVELGGLQVFPGHTVDALVDEVFIFDRILTVTELNDACTYFATPMPL